MSKGYWINNEQVIWKDMIKPCRLCGYCPYGQLVEEFPIPFIPRADAIAHHEYMIKALADGVFDNTPNKENPFMLNRAEAQKEIDDFNPDDYPENPLPVNKMQCEVFGHHCPVYYHAELFAEEKEPTDDEIKAFNTEVEEAFKELEKEINERKM
jgi:hypothetical protein